MHSAADDHAEIQTAQSGRYCSCSAGPLHSSETPRRAIELDANNRRPDPRARPRKVPDLDRRLAPLLALYIIAILGAALACFWVAYRLNGEA